MSTILKALRRVEGDRNAQSARPLREEVASGGPEARSRSRLGWLLLTLVGVGSGVVAGSLAFLSVRSEPEALRAPQAPVVASRSAPRPLPAAPAEPAPLRPAELLEPELAAPAAREAPLEPAGELPPAALASRVERVERPPAEPRIGEAEEPAPLQPLAVAPRRDVPAPVVAALPPSQMPGRHLPLASSRVPAAEPEPAEEPELSLPVRGVPIPEPEPSDTQRAIGSAGGSGGGSSPAPESPRPVVRAPVPPVIVKETSWHPNADRRWALVDLGDGSLLQVHEGDAVGPMVVQEIKPSGVRFDHDGIEVEKGVGD